MNRTAKDPLHRVPSYAGTNRASVLMAIVVLLSPVPSARATVRYVDASSTNAVPPYTSWATAAVTIQAAAALAVSGDEVVVTNGAYATGGKAVYGTMTNRVVVPSGVVIRSINGPAVTVIAGAAAPGGGNGDGAIRCAYVSANAVLSGFTLTNGHTCAAGDISKEQSGGGVCFESSGLITNCFLTENSATWFGGGAYYWGTLNNCTVTRNSAGLGGGGTGESTVNNSVLSYNYAPYGGGAKGGTFNNCTIVGNSASRSGGGIYWADARNCIIYYNSGPGGANCYGPSVAQSCTTPLASGPGNFAEEPLLASATHLSAQSPCIGRGSPTYTNGVDIDGEAWLGPPCVGADQFVAGQTIGPLTVGLIATYTNFATGFAVPFEARIEGQLFASVWEFGDGSVASNRPFLSHAWATPGDYTVRLTAYSDAYPGGISATTTVQVAAAMVYYADATNANSAPPHTDWAGAARTLQEAVDAGTQIGRLVLVNDGIYDSGGRAVFGTMTNRLVVPEGVEVRSVNGPAATVIVGAAATGGGNGDGAVRCAYVGSNALLSGFTLTNGHTRIAGDLDREQCGGGASLEASGAITNCILRNNSAYRNSGGAHRGTLNNCTLIANTADQGGGCFNSILNYCTLTGCSAGLGGAAHECTLTHCKVSGNSASSGGGVSSGLQNNCYISTNTASSLGGGSYQSILNNCALVGNAANTSGGAHQSRLYNCTLVGNSASGRAGATYLGTLNNCIAYYNSAPSDPNYYGSQFTNSCTTPLPVFGSSGNLTNEPYFVDYPVNLRLQAGSPCINAGINHDAPGSQDLDGRPRLAGSAVDIGAYEFQEAVPGEFIGWLQQYGLPTNGSADDADSDCDGHSNRQEWVAATDPTNTASALRLDTPLVETSGVVLRWPSVSSRTYFVERATQPAGAGAFTLLQDNIPGLPESTGFADTNAAPGVAYFYRIGVRR